MHTFLDRYDTRQARRPVNVLVNLTAGSVEHILPSLLNQFDNRIKIKVVTDVTKSRAQDRLAKRADLTELPWLKQHQEDKTKGRLQGHQLAKWADIMIMVADAGSIAIMLGGHTSDVLLQTLRCWDISKRIVLLPEMTLAQVRQPIWCRHKVKIERRFQWIHLLEPAILDLTLSECESEDYEGTTHSTTTRWMWDGSQELVQLLESELQAVWKRDRSNLTAPVSSKKGSAAGPVLPAEMWTLIFDHLDDWELATALSIYTHIPTPSEWESLVPAPGCKGRSLEWIMLTQPVEQVKAFFETRAKEQQPPSMLSEICMKLIFRFSRTDVLTYLASSQKDIFWPSFPSTVLPHKASCMYNAPTILQWWKDCPTIIEKSYDEQAMDGASRQGFIEVLQWWLDSGLEPRYTDRALENASSKGLVDVLDWWRSNNSKLAGSDRELPLKVGKSIWLAAQCGRDQVISWWERSDIAYGHEERVATVASMGGHVHVLDLWFSLKGSKMIFDNQVLVGPTKQGHAAVLEWWKEASRKSGLRVEYKTCDIEEAMEDAVGGGGESAVREWWARNGLNLGVGSLEWMKVKTL